MTHPVLAELFTSQSCSSCPPAEELFNELAKLDHVVAIQWHVDYWDNLVHGRDGKWKDPFSSRANTTRQRNYNLALRGTGGVYTPQAVIAGATETTGSRASEVVSMIRAAPAAIANISVDTSADSYSITVTPHGNSIVAMDAEIMLVWLSKHEETDIQGGENRGLSVTGVNIAIGSDMLGPWSGKSETYRAEPGPEGLGCAIIVQDKSTARILGARYCS